jgi:MoaA/NifB/PqqE/SkfB family radical SAM enzyme
MSLNQNSLCDVNCRGCFRYPQRKGGLNNLLTFPDYELLLEKFNNAGGLALEISGEGEPLLSNNTLPIIRLASSLGIWTTLITNGHLLNEKIITELKNLKVVLVISLHSLDRFIYEQDCGVKGNFTKKMEIIYLVSKIFKDSDWQENERLIKRFAIHWTLQADNSSELETVKKFSHSLGFLFSVAPLAKTGHAENMPSIWLPENLSNLDDINELGDESIIFYDEPDGRKVCGTCKYGLNVGGDGQILLDAHGGYEVEIGDIRKIGFKKAVELQHKFSQKMFNDLNHFCPVRDEKWPQFLKQFSIKHL